MPIQEFIMIGRTPNTHQLQPNMWRRLRSPSMPIHLALLMFSAFGAGCQRDNQPSVSTEWEAARPDGVDTSEDVALTQPDALEKSNPDSALTNDNSLASTVTDSWGRRFFADVERFQQAPKIRELRLPLSDGDEAIWGATGRDAKGRIYFGLASKASSELSAGLLQFSPRTGEAKLLGRVDEWLSGNASNRNTSLQDKIHSKLFEAIDGNLYFASQDETDEVTDGSANGKAGGHLLRLNHSTGKVESVLHTPEALISVGCSGRYIYALGYFGSTIYQFDTKTQKVHSILVPNYGGHVSRNLLVTPTGHVMAIRVTPTASEDTRPGTNWTTPVAHDDAKEQFVLSEEGSPKRRVFVELVELDTQLKELHAWPLDGYEAHGHTSSHGITSFSSQMDGSILFTTQNGMLWRVYPSGENPGRLESLGWIHPEGESSSIAMFAPTGRDFVIAVSKLEGRFDLLVYYLKLRESVPILLDPDSDTVFNQPLHLLYGSETLDDYGNAYLAGWKRMPTGYEPLALQLRWHRRNSVNAGSSDRIP
jgi:hypothetical protein